VTVACKKEIPRLFLNNQHVGVLTLAHLKNRGFINFMQKSWRQGIVFVVTGVGMKASREAAKTIQKFIAPKYVLNIGTCGTNKKIFSTGQWVMPEKVSNLSKNRERDRTISLLDTLPIPWTKKLTLKRAGHLYSTAVEVKNISDISYVDIIDMECYEQAKFFERGATSFHVIKYLSDYCDQNFQDDYTDNLYAYIENFKIIFEFLSPSCSQNISVVIPTYNRKSSVVRCIQSVLNQSQKPCEILVVDDYSTDGTSEVLKKFGEKISLILLNKNRGVSFVRNYGVSFAKGEWIAFLDSDDEWTVDKLKIQCEYLWHFPFYQIIQSEERWIRHGVRVNACNHHKKFAGWLWRASLERCMISPSSVIVRKNLLENWHGFDENLPVCEDYDLWIKISRNYVIGLTPQVTLVKYGGHEDQLSRKFEAIDRFRVYSLLGALDREARGECVQLLCLSIICRLEILITGSLKRNQKEKVAAYTCLRNLVQSVLLDQKVKIHRGGFVEALFYPHRKGVL